jgi:hypothetical protein
VLVCVCEVVVFVVFFGCVVGRCVIRWVWGCGWWGASVINVGLCERGWLCNVCRVGHPIRLVGVIGVGIREHATRLCGSMVGTFCP